MTTAELETLLRDFALQLPESDEAFPWGERALRVRGKAFVFMRLEGEHLSFSVKLPHSRAQALALPFVQPTHYGLGRHGWVTVDVTRPGRALTGQFKDWILESFRAVAPKRVAALLDASVPDTASHIRVRQSPPKRTSRAKP